MRKTKIVCTIGPASHDKNIISQMIDSGMNVARLNFSHGTHESHKKNIDTIKQLRKEKDVPLALLLDTKGPEIRLGDFKNQSVELVEGNLFMLTMSDEMGTNEKVSITLKTLAGQIQPKTKILIDDGNLELRVEDIQAGDIICRVVRGGIVSSKKGVNIPGIEIDMPYLSPKDESDLLFGIEQGVEFIAASFVRTADDVLLLKNFIEYHGNTTTRVIAKIENMQGVENFDKILEVSDGIMIARGDMGVELEYELLPGLQKKFIRKCLQLGKMVITATQMLESMIVNANPTRAEITDVANAVFDGTSAVMLSGETAAGKNPVKSVEVMAKIALQAEKDAFNMDIFQNFTRLHSGSTTNAICEAATITARDLAATAIVAVTKSGHTARGMSKFRSAKTIIAATPEPITYHQLALSWGVLPILSLQQTSSDKLFAHAIACAKKTGVVKKNDMVIIAAGIPLDTPGSTNMLKIEIVG